MVEGTGLRGRLRVFARRIGLDPGHALRRADLDRIDTGGADERMR